MKLRDYQQGAELYKLPESRKRARLLNSKFYFDGKRCLRGHLSPRYTSSCNCRDCIEEKRGVVFSNFRGHSSIRSHENQNLAITAWELGYSKYISLTPCKYGHLARYVTTNNCIECDRVTQAKYKEKRRWAAIKKKYGISKHQFYEIINNQEGKCAICTIELTEKNSHVDHNHKTKELRGILCVRCNQGIGSFLENIDIIKSAVKYIEYYNE